MIAALAAREPGGVPREGLCRSSWVAEIPKVLGDSSTVEQRTLTPLILVRIQVPQPIEVLIEFWFRTLDSCRVFTPVFADFVRFPFPARAGVLAGFPVSGRICRGSDDRLTQLGTRFED